MKILCTSDWHLRTTNPRYRIDGFFASQIDKVKWVIGAAEVHGCGLILIGGDVFDSPDIPNWAKLELIQIFYRSDIPLFTVFGQHDMKYRRPEDTVLSVFDETEVIYVLNEKPEIEEDGVCIYGTSYNGQIHEPKDPDKTNVLVIHKMIVEDKPLWPGQTGHSQAKKFIQKHSDYDLIVSGDNHNTFIKEYHGTTLINPGSLMRTKTDQQDHEPSVFIYDTKTKETERLKIPILPFHKVMNLELSEATKERNHELEAFMSGLESDYSIDLNFEENLKQLMEQNSVNKSTKDKALEIMGRYYG